MSGSCLGDVISGGSGVAVINDLKKIIEECIKAGFYVVMTMDEMDSIGKRKSDNNYSFAHDNSGTTAFLTFCDWAAKQSNLVIIGTTNRPNKIDAAITRKGRCIAIDMNHLNEEDAKQPLLTLSVRNCKMKIRKRYLSITRKSVRRKVFWKKICTRLQT